MERPLNARGCRLVINFSPTVSQITGAGEEPSKVRVGGYSGVACNGPIVRPRVRLILSKIGAVTPSISDPPDFNSFAAPLLGLPVSRIWQGYGSAIFLEFGRLHSTRKRGGQPGSPRGDWTLMIEWSWRIEGKRRIWCGSWSDGERWPRAFARLQNQLVTTVTLFGRLPEIDLGFANGLHLVSMMTAEGDPAWALTKRADEASVSMAVRAGRLYCEEALADLTS